MRKLIILLSLIVTLGPTTWAQQLVQVQLGRPGIAIDTQAWAAIGMARVVSGPVTFDAVPASAIGAPGQYLARPGFWHGGAGIAACCI
jgi:hypothetical protein